MKIPNAWVEHCWRWRLDWALRANKSQAGGYYLYVPVKQSEILDDQGNPKVMLKLDDASAKYSSAPGIGYEMNSSDHGFAVYFDTLPKTLNFLVEERGRTGWSTPAVTGMIQFTRNSE